MCAISLADILVAETAGATLVVAEKSLNILRFLCILASVQACVFVSSVWRERHFFNCDFPELVAIFNPRRYVYARAGVRWCFRYLAHT